MKLRFTRPALDDLADVLDYLDALSPAAAFRVKGRIKAVTELIVRHPRIGRRTDDADIRRIAATPYSYLIFYEVREDEVIVHAVRHGARDPDDMPGQI